MPSAGCQSLQPGARCSVPHAVSISPSCKEIPRVHSSGWEGVHSAPGLTTSPRCLSLHTGEFCDPGDRQRRVQPALPSPFPFARPPPGCMSDAGSCLELLPPPGLPNSAQPVSSTSCVYLAAKSPRRREEEEGGEPLPLPLRARGALLRRAIPGSPAPLRPVPSAAPCCAPHGAVWGGREGRGCLKPGFASHGGGVSWAWMVAGLDNASWLVLRGRQCGTAQHMPCFPLHHRKRKPTA